MCLLAIAINAHPRYRLVFAGNRDEFHARPAAAAGWWTDAPWVFGGRDLEAGGSWLGLTRSGRFAVVTNYREPGTRLQGKRSRGELVGNFLTSDASPADYLSDLETRAGEYTGFNLLFGDANSFHYFSNRLPEDQLDDIHRVLDGSVHALSNHLLDTPWPKVERLRAQFLGELGQDAPRTERLLSFLEDTTPAPMEQLPDTGLSPEWEQRLSAARITSDAYGTRASTIVLVSIEGDCTFIERRFDTKGQISGETREHFEAR